jgi:hypothetical protein
MHKEILIFSLHLYRTGFPATDWTPHRYGGHT